MPGSAIETDQVWFRTDGAWDALADFLADRLPCVDVREESRHLRFITSGPRIEAFAARHATAFRPFTLYGSGDFHHLSALWTRQFEEPFSLVSFDNHPDWDIRPPRWSCGAWINRALENPQIQGVSIWGCGNFECNLPGRWLGNRKAAQEGRLLVHPWAQAGCSYPSWLSPLTPETWKSHFLGRLKKNRGANVYVTIDLDCLTPDTLTTNWEQGRFTCDDLVWALGHLQENAKIIGGDLCGAWSPPQYGSSLQAWAGWFDHPKVAAPEITGQAQRLREIFERLWPALTGDRAASPCV